MCLPEEVDELGAGAPEDLRGAMVDRVGLVDRVVVFVWERESRRFLRGVSWRIGAFFVGVVRRCFLSGRRVTGIHGWRVSLGMSWDGRIHIRVGFRYRMELWSGCALYV